MFLTDSISMKTNWSTGSSQVKSFLVILIELRTSGLKMVDHIWQIGPSDSLHLAISNLNSPALAAANCFKSVIT